MKMTSVFDETIAVCRKPAQFEIDRPTKAAAPAQNHVLPHNLRGGAWETLAFLGLWLGALATMGYCFAIFLSLSGPFHKYAHVRGKGFFGQTRRERRAYPEVDL
ncbi:MAG: hypothetical protein FJ398_14890 [Verrucomicrobia bacterium]|nr:hypothetical protein [Verrucomicrobiota bacterium]